MAEAVRDKSVVYTSTELPQPNKQQGLEAAPALESLTSPAILAEPIKPESSAASTLTDPDSLLAAHNVPGHTLDVKDTQSEMITRPLSGEELSRIKDKLEDLQPDSQEILFVFITLLQREQKLSGMNVLKLLPRERKRVTNALDALDLPNNALFNDYPTDPEAIASETHYVVRVDGFPIPRNLWLDFADIINDVVEPEKIIKLVEEPSTFRVNFPALYEIAQLAKLPEKPEPSHVFVSPDLPYITEADDVSTPETASFQALEATQPTPAENLKALIADIAKDMDSAGTDTRPEIATQIFRFVSELLAGKGLHLEGIDAGARENLNSLLSILDSEFNIQTSMVPSGNGEGLEIAFDSTTNGSKADMFRQLESFRDRVLDAMGLTVTTQPSESAIEPSKLNLFGKASRRALVGAASMLSKRAQDAGRSIFNFTASSLSEAQKYRVVQKERAKEVAESNKKAEQDRFEDTTSRFAQIIEGIDLTQFENPTELTKQFEELLTMAFNTRFQEGFIFTTDHQREIWKKLLDLVQGLYENFKQFTEVKGTDGVLRSAKMWGSQAGELSEFLYVTSEVIRRDNHVNTRAPESAAEWKKTLSARVHLAWRLLQYIRSPRFRKTWDTLTSKLPDLRITAGDNDETSDGNEPAPSVEETVISSESTDETPETSDDTSEAETRKVESEIVEKKLEDLKDIFLRNTLQPYQEEELKEQLDQNWNDIDPAAILREGAKIISNGVVMYKSEFVSNNQEFFDNLIEILIIDGSNWEAKEITTGQEAGSVIISLRRENDQSADTAA